MKIIIPKKFTRGHTKGWPIKGKIRVPEGEGQGTYILCDGIATSKTKEIADFLGLEYKSSWSSARIAQAILEKVLGASYVKPTRGASEEINNVAIFDDYAICHAYYNNGCGLSDSIQKYCWVYKLNK